VCMWVDGKGLLAKVGLVKKKTEEGEKVGGV
jgi:hypothetical protein